ncbi:MULTISPECIES: methylated-DNA--[protein]-cysteine S-methyltransferase [unclassified Virgibacillus]|uniref:MGMT family protein n=1 Tax=unclassified Virgibacillus TaxID=2620237 RepID=UPI0024DE7396|nr:methylated-DNA--[protein]-cysteine S-methyltransferase [Virgibacillus sp. LDC-1]
MKAESSTLTPFTKRVLTIINQIPIGHVMAYGQVAAAAGNPRAARQVARILHSMSDKYQLPWHRVLNKTGKISLRGEAATRQRRLLEQEGIVINEQNQVKMAAYQYIPKENAFDLGEYI